MADGQLITDKLKPEKHASQWLGANISRSLIFGFFKRLNVGRLTIYENGVQHSFGDNDDVHATIQVHDQRFYASLIKNGSIGAAESYIHGWWDSPNVTNVVELFSANLHVIDSIEKIVNFFTAPYQPIARWLQRNTKKRAKQNIVAHYDLGNNLYSRFLDSTMLYSSAIYPTPSSTLLEASTNKLKVICESLELKATDHIVEIGTGWGGLAIYAATHYGCKVTTTTISDEQYRYTKELIINNGLQDRIELLQSDYRDLEGQYDKLVSIEMIEAVGHKYFNEYFRVCNRLLKPNGKMLIQAILIADERYEIYKKGTDFIQKYIFPGSALPSKSTILQIVSQNTEMQLVNYLAFGDSYARTLADWRAAFNNNWQAIKPLGYDENFKRLWNFYLYYCEGGFLQKRIDVAHFLFEKNVICNT